MLLLKKEIYKKIKKAKSAQEILKNSSIKKRNDFLFIASNEIINKKNDILKENLKDIKIFKEKSVSKVLIDRLLLTKSRIENISKNIKKIIYIKDPIGAIEKGWKTEENLEINKIRVPLGLIGIIFESRPNVIVDSVALALKSGNAIILRGSSSAYYSNKILFSILKNSIKKSDLPEESIQLIKTKDRKAIDILISMKDFLDVVIPRGGKELIKYVIENSKVPIIETGTGICHCYVDNKCDIDMAVNIICNGKLQRPSVCNSLETLLIHEKMLKKIIFKIEKKFILKNVEIRACKNSYKFFKKAKKAKKDDFGKEFLDYIISIKSVKNIDEAIKHINNFGSKHSEVIVTNNYENANKFKKEIDSACIFVNSSTRFSDGDIFGFGSEIGISTQKIHSRGPMGVKDLTTIKYLINGNGQIRK